MAASICPVTRASIGVRVAVAMPDESSRHERPVDRLTRIAERVSELIEDDPEYRDGDRAIVSIFDPDHAGTGLFGYESDTDAMVDMFLLLRAVARANGKDLEYVGIPDSPAGLADP